jgi:hypothetical protein
MDSQLTDLQRQWAEAELRGDAAFLESLLVDDFVGVGPFGFLLTKEQWLNRYRSGDLRYEEFVWQDVATRLYDDAAVAVGRQTQTGAYQGQPTPGRDFRTTLIFVRRDGTWRLAGSHISLMGPPPGAPGATPPTPPRA